MFENRFIDKSQMNKYYVMFKATEKNQHFWVNQVTSRLTLHFAPCFDFYHKLVVNDGQPLGLSFTTNF